MLDRWWKSPPLEREEVAWGHERRFVIRRDSFGIPAISARTTEDGVTGWGYACAADRYFQITWQRRILRGTLAALVGERALDGAAASGALRGMTTSDLDLLARQLDLAGAARRSLAACGPDGRDFARAYADGINLWLERNGPPLESRLLDDTPERWIAEDCAIIAKGMALMLSFSWRAAVADWAARASSHRLDLRSVPIASAIDGASQLAALGDALRAALGAGPQSAASNAVVIAPHRSRTAGPLVASDPHMPLSSPCVFWEGALDTREIRFQGATVPGAPMVSMGQTDHAAWGITSGWGDDSQLYLESKAELARAEASTIVIPRRSTQPRRVWALRTPRGPVVSAAIPALRDADGGISMRWVGAGATRELDAAVATLRASNVAGIRAALSNHSAPSINVVFADRAGDIAYQFAGQIARRKRGGLSVADSADPDAAWTETLAFDQLPHCENPPYGVIVSANTHPDGQRPWLTPLTEPPFRFIRWHQLLAATPLVGADDLAQFQRDVTSGWAREFSAMLAPHIDNRYRARFARWDGHAHRGSNTAAVVYATARELMRDLGGSEPSMAPTFEFLNAPLLPVTRAIARRLAERDGDTVARAALERAESFLRESLGRPDQWRWGALHTARFRHPLQGSPIGALFAIPPTELGGDGTTIAMASMQLGGDFEAEIGPSVRLVMDVRQPQRSRGVMTPGQSGHVRSPHFADQLPLWAEGRLRSLHAPAWR